MTTKEQSGSSTRLDRRKFAWEIVKGSAIAVAAVFSFFASQQSASNSVALDRFKLDLDARAKQAEQEATERARQAELNIKVYELVERTLSLEGPTARGHGFAAAALVNALATMPLRSQLLNALRAGATDPQLVKMLDDTLGFDDQEIEPQAAPGSATIGAEPKTTSRLEQVPSSLLDILFPPLLAQPRPGALKGHRVDIFYCEGETAATTSARKNRAQAAGALLIKLAGPDVVVRVRDLPKLVQARPGYKSFADEIRYGDGSNDREAATQLASTLKISPENLRRSPTPTPGYLTVFYCRN